MNLSIQQMEGAAVVAVTESAFLSYICCINILSKNLVTCNNSLDWLTECKFLWCALSQTDQSGLWALADRPMVIEYNHNTNYPACTLLQGFAL